MPFSPKVLIWLRGAVSSIGTVNTRHCHRCPRLTLMRRLPPDMFRAPAGVLAVLSRRRGMITPPSNRMHTEGGGL